MINLLVHIIILYSIHVKIYYLNKLIAIAGMLRSDTINEYHYLRQDQREEKTAQAKAKLPG